jgi:RNase H-fold protein (predicted Holliday junction resolvase)
LRGEHGEQAQETARFVERLRAALPETSVETFDERFTTRMAAESAAAGARGAEDSLAAAHLLTSYLEWLSATRT